MTSGAATTPASVTRKRAPASVVATRSTSRRVSASPRRFLYSASTGTNACEKAPSANSRRRKLGSLKATKKASVTKPAPKTRAITRSRTKPRMREMSVMLLTVATALSRFMACRVTLGGRCKNPRTSVRWRPFSDSYSEPSPEFIAHGQHRIGAQARTSGRDPPPPQRCAALGAAQRDQERQESDRRRRQEGRPHGARRRLQRHRLDRRQAHHPQERRGSSQEPPGRADQGDGLKFRKPPARRLRRGACPCVPAAASTRCPSRIRAGSGTRRGPSPRASGPPRRSGCPPR